MIIYAICLVAGLIFTLISAVASHFFGGHDVGHSDIGTGGHAESGFNDSGVPGISFFSPTVLSSFVTAFGAFGMIFTKIDATSNAWASAPLSIACGGLVAWGVFLFFNAMFSRMQGSSEARVSQVVGTIASIITPIPENGVGEIAYVQGGSRYTAPARSEKGVAISAGQAVKVTRIVGTQYFVETTD